MVSQGDWTLQSQSPPPSYSKALDANDVQKEYSCPPHTDSSRSDIQEGTIRNGNSVVVKLSSAPRKGWKPYSMRAPSLVFFILCSFAIAAVIEVLAQKSQRQGGLSLRKSDDDFSGAVRIAYMYLPTTIAVLYSLFWTCVDLDIRRIQPWLDLSQEKGATAESSLLLDYPFEFLAFVPLKAARSRHWLVFFGGTIMMLIFWGITPFQSAIFGMKEVSLDEDASMVRAVELGSLDQQLNAMDGMIFDNTYGVTWLGQPYPAFTTPKYAALPFAPMDSGESQLPDEKWTGTTMIYKTDLQCWPANVTQNEGSAYTFDNGQGCSAPVEFLGLSGDVEYSLLYIGWHEQARLDWWLSSPQCGSNASHQFLAAYKKKAKDETQQDSVTALFCEPTYWKQHVRITVSATQQQPDESSLIPLGQPERLEESEFNSTAFEYLIGTGVPPKETLRDYPRVAVVDLYTELFDQHLSWPTTNMVGYALGGTNHSLEELGDPTVLQTVFLAAHRNLFSVTVPQMLSQSAGTTVQNGMKHYTLYGVVVNRLFAILVETLLCVVACMAAALLAISSKTRTLLSADPGGSGATLALLGASKNLLEEFTDKDCLDEESLKASLQGNRFKLVAPGGESASSIAIERVAEGIADEPYTSNKTPPARPTALQPLVGFGFVLSMLTAIGVLIYFKSKEISLGGLPRPTDNFNVLQLLENYVPTIFATLIEPLLVLLNRFLCLLQPFSDLRKGNAAARTTIDTTYTSIPPQLTIWRALQSRHVLLLSFCVCSLLANVLAIAMGGLFNELAVDIDYPQQFQQNITLEASRAQIDPYPIAGTWSHFYIAMANLSSEVNLPPWINQEFAYFPFSMTAGSSLDTVPAAYRAQTRGFGISASCSLLSQTPGTYPFASYSLDSNGTQSFYTEHDAGNGTTIKCTAANAIPELTDTNGKPLTGVYKREVSDSLLPGNYTDKSVEMPPGATEYCEQRLILSWVKIEAAVEESRLLQQAHIQCLPTLKSALFDVQVDQSGHVLASDQVSEFDNPLSLTDSEMQTVMLDIANMIGARSSGLNSMLVGSGERWHNDSFTRDWWNYLLRLKLNSSALVDPAADLPDMNAIVPQVEGLYGMLFSIILGRHLSFFNTTSAANVIAGTKTVTETRIFVDNTALTISLCILALNIVVVSALYIRERDYLLPRLPTTIGSLAAYVAASRAVRTYVRPGVGQRKGPPDKEREEQRYSYGKYTGVDGRAHVGIEFAQYVMPYGLSDTGKSATLRERFGNKSGWFRRRR